MFSNAAILVGGKSRRMGFDKTRIKIGNTYLLDKIVEKLTLNFSNIIFVGDNDYIQTHYSNKIIKDILPDIGPLGGLYTALKHFNQGYVFLTACDMPIIDVNLINTMKLQLITYIKSNEKPYAILGKHGNNNYVEPFQSFYSCDLIPHIEYHLKYSKKDKKSNLSIQSIILKKNPFFLPVENTEYAINLNSKDDLSTYLNTNFRI